MWRRLGPADHDALLDLANACDVAEVGEPMSTTSEITSDLVSPDLETVGVDDGDGLAAYAWIDVRASNEKAWSDVRTRPGRHAELFEPLLGWTRSRLGELGGGQAQWVFADSANVEKMASLEAAGGVIVRRFNRMLIEFEATPPAPSSDLEPEVGIRRIEDSETDLRAVYDVVRIAFRDHFGYEDETFEEWNRQRFGFCPDLSLYWLATVDGEPAAALYAAELPTAGYVDTLGTLREFRGRGLGRALLLTAFGEFHRRGVLRVTLGVDATNPTGANRLYESVGMSVAHSGLRYELPPAVKESS